MLPITKGLFVFLLFVSSAFSHESDHKCTHDHKERPDPEFLDIDEENFPVTESKSNRMLATASNFRMYAYTDLLSGKFQAYMRDMVAPAVISFFQAALKVKYPVRGALRIGKNIKKMCSISVPSVFYTGVSADYSIIFSTSNDGSGGSVAESFICYSASGTQRPLIARTNINSALFSDASSDVLRHEKNIYLVMHEITHTLGFSNGLYKYFLDENGKKRTGHIKSGTLNGKKSIVLDVQPLTAKLREFFGCSTLTGAYMENSGSSMTAGSHFERRQFVFEAMSSGLIYQQAFSQFTLALLEGSGWYTADYSMADPYWFGQGQGCTFLTGKCGSTGFKFDEFCTGSQRGCTVTGRGGGYCASDVRSDDCKYYQADKNFDCENPKAGENGRLANLQSFGRDSGSKCFTGTLSSYSSAPRSSYCFKYNCTGSGSTVKLDVIIGSKKLTCTEAGSMSVPGYKGYITCLDPLTFCSTIGAKVCPRGCMGRGDCVQGKCVCDKGFTGKDCALIAPVKPVVIVSETSTTKTEVNVSTSSTQTEINVTAASSTITEVNETTSTTTSPVISLDLGEETGMLENQEGYQGEEENWLGFLPSLEDIGSALTLDGVESIESFDNILIVQEEEANI